MEAVFGLTTWIIHLSREGEGALPYIKFVGGDAHIAP